MNGQKSGARAGQRSGMEQLVATTLIQSDDGELASASAVLQVRATNAQYNQPALRIDQASARGGAASMKIVDPNPDIEFVESDAANAGNPARGKYEIAVQADELQINGRKADDSGFETIMLFQRPGAGGNVGFRTGSQFGAGQGVIAIRNAIVAPSVNPGGGGVLYVQDGALRYRGSEGTVTTIAPA
jgi:hypothetical protein